MLDSIFAASTGSIVGPVETDFGFHIIFVEKIKGQDLELRHILMAAKVTPDALKEAKDKIELIKQRILNKEITLSAPIKNQSIVLVDDVCNSGKTLVYALMPLLQAAPSAIKIAVLVERKHTAFPIAPDFVGLSVATTLQDHIIVETSNNELIQAYLQ